MPLAETKKVAAPKRGDRVTKPPQKPATKRVRPKVQTVIIDGVTIPLHRPAGKGVLKRSEIVRAVKKVVANRKLAEGTGAKHVPEK